MKRVLVITFAALLLIGIAPILGMIVATFIANAAGCTLNEAGSYPCLIMGADWGKTLNFLFVAAWLFLLSFPLALIGALGLAVMGLVALIHISRG